MCNYDYEDKILDYTEVNGFIIGEVILLMVIMPILVLLKLFGIVKWEMLLLPILFFSAINIISFILMMTWNYKGSGSNELSDRR